MTNILLLDWTKINDFSATGNIKKILLKLDDVKIYQIYEKKFFFSIKFLKFIDYNTNVEKIISSQANLQQIINNFNIDILLIRPVEQSNIINNLLKQLKQINKPIIFAYFDNWLNKQIKNENFFKYLMKKSNYIWSISNDMSKYLMKKYGLKNFIVLQNSISHNFKNFKKKINSKILIRYSGSLSENMNFDVIRFFSKLNLPNCKFEINTRFPYTTGISSSVIGGSYFDSYSDYLNWIKSADILLLGYNFDKLSFNYTKFSFPNKLPEYLSTGNGIVYIGPTNTSTYKFLHQHKIGFCFKKNSNQITNFLKDYSPDYYKKYNKKNIIICNKEFSLKNNKIKLTKVLNECLRK